MTGHASALVFACVLTGIVSVRAQPQALAPSDPNREYLKALVGDWTVDVTYIIAGREQRGSAQMHAEWILADHFLRQEYHAPIGGRDLVTLQFLGYDPVRPKFTILKMDSLDDAMVFADGDLSGDRRVVTFVGERSDVMTRTTGRLRQILTLSDADHFTLEWFLMPTGGIEAKTVSMVHSRKARLDDRAANWSAETGHWQRPVACRVRKSLFTPLGRTRERHHREDLGAQCERHRMPTALQSADLPQVA
jgi:Protein of unknown function (DUF1579)